MGCWGTHAHALNPNKYTSKLLSCELASQSSRPSLIDLVRFSLPPALLTASQAYLQGRRSAANDHRHGESAGEPDSFTRDEFMWLLEDARRELPGLRLLRQVCGRNVWRVFMQMVYMYMLGQAIAGSKASFLLKGFYKLCAEENSGQDAFSFMQGSAPSPKLSLEALYQFLSRVSSHRVLSRKNVWEELKKENLVQKFSDRLSWRPFFSLVMKARDRKHVFDILLLREARIIHDVFVKTQARFQVNIRSSVRSAITKRIEADRPDIDMFDDAALEIMSLMCADSFARFKNTPLYTDFLSSMKLNSNWSDVKVQQKTNSPVPRAKFHPDLFKPVSGGLDVMSSALCAAFDALTVGSPELPCLFALSGGLISAV